MAGQYKQPNHHHRKQHRPRVLHNPNANKYLYMGKNRNNYKKLTVIAEDANEDIWISDLDGFFVQKGNGLLETSLLYGDYNVQFGTPKSPRYKITLYKKWDADHIYRERDLSRPDCEE